MPDDIKDASDLRHRLTQMDIRYRALPPRERTPKMLREIAKAYIREIQTYVYGRKADFTVAEMLLESLLLADESKLHPLIAQDHSFHRARPYLTVDRAQAVAAATLEYICTDFQEPQNAWAEQIISELGKHGLELYQRNYSASALIKWRKACAIGKHSSSEFYAQTLTELRGSGCAPREALSSAIRHCQLAFGHRKR